MKKLILIAAVALLLSGCASPRQTMVDPKTGITQDCAALGFGFIGVPVAYEMRRACVKEMKAAGMVELEEFQQTGGKVVAGKAPASTLTVESDPPGADIYSGMNEDEVTTLLGASPFSLPHPSGGRMWARECYRGTMDGYFDSPVTCYEQVFGDRTVKVKLSKK